MVLDEIYTFGMKVVLDELVFYLSLLKVKGHEFGEFARRSAANHKKEDSGSRPWSQSRVGCGSPNVGKKGVE